MHIDDKTWDQLILESCDIVNAIEHLVSPRENETNPEIIRRKNLFYSCAGILQAFVNLNDSPVELSSIKNVEESRLQIIIWTLKQLFRIKRKSRSCCKCR